MPNESVKSQASSNLFKDIGGNTIDNYPSEIDNLFLLGIDDSGGWYFDPSSISVHNYILEDKSDGEYSQLELEFSMNKDEIRNSFEDVSSISEDLIDRSSIGHALVMSKKLCEETHLTEQRAKVYAFRDLFNIGRKQTSRILNKSPNTIDNQRSKARREAQKAMRFVEITEEYNTD